MRSIEENVHSKLLLLPPPPPTNADVSTSRTHDNTAIDAYAPKHVKMGMERDFEMNEVVVAW